MSDSPGTNRPSERRAARLARRRAAGGAAVLRPKEVRTQLAVSASTLRDWSTAYKDYLSPAAQVAPAPGRAHRRYTAADVHARAHRQAVAVRPPVRGGQAASPVTRPERRARRTGRQHPTRRVRAAPAQSGGR